MIALNPMLAGLEPDVEGLIVNRLADPPLYVIAPIDRCYALTGTIKAQLGGDLRWRRVERRCASFFEGLRAAGGGQRERRRHGREHSRQARTAAAPTRPCPSPTSRCSARARSSTRRRRC